MLSSAGASPAASGILVQPLRAATECEVDLVRKRPDHGNGLRPWIPKQRPEFHLCATESQRLNLNLPMWGLVADEPQREADQDRRKGRQPRPLYRLPDGRGRHPTANVPGDFAPDRGTPTATATSASMKRSIALHSTATDGRSTSKCQAK